MTGKDHSGSRRKWWRVFLSPATATFMREADTVPGYRLLDRLHAMLYAKWPFMYIGTLTGRHPLYRWLLRPLMTLAGLFGGGGQGGSGLIQAFAAGYHGKVLPLKEATRLITVNRDIDLPGLERVIPYPKARDLILRHPEHITLLDCPCRSVMDKPCLPLDVCLVVGEPFASLIATSHPTRSRKITPEQAVDILKAECARGHVAHAFFKDAMLGRFFAICNCCACCCAAMRGHASGVPMLASSGYVCEVDSERCKGCGLCVPACQFRAIRIQDRRAVVDEAACMGCGVCVQKCAKQAMHLRTAPERGLPLDVEVLEAERRAGTL